MFSWISTNQSASIYLNGKKTAFNVTHEVPNDNYNNTNRNWKLNLAINTSSVVTYDEVVIWERVLEWIEIQGMYEFYRGEVIIVVSFSLFDPGAQHIVLMCVMSCYVMLCYIVLMCVMSCYVMSCYVVLMCVMSCCVMSCYVVLMCVMPCYVMLC